MKIKFLMNALEGDPSNPPMMLTRAQIWEGEMEIPNGVIVCKVSVIAEGEAHPICDIPFSLNLGHWQWHPPEIPMPEEVERVGGMGFDESGKVAEQ